MKIGIYGGTFDPPHIGHLSAAAAAVNMLGIDRLIMIPDAAPPHKEMSSLSASGGDRLNMLKLAAKYVPNACVSGMELHRGGKSYSYDTICEIKAANPDDDVYMFIGTDMLLTFDEWYRYSDIFKICDIAVFARKSGDTDEIEKKAAFFREKFGAEIHIVYNDAVDISSSKLREDLSRREGGQYLPREVYAYITERKLYEIKPSFDYLRTAACEMLTPKRTRHVMGCEAEAVSLAKRWGADTEKAREAAILHDITKNLNLNDQLILCDKYDIMTDIAERSDEKLLHAKTGAAVAKARFSVCDEVYDAIFWHTTGRAEMSLLEKIIYLADYIEPSRDFEGLNKLRLLSYTNIDEAMILGLEMSLEDMCERGIVPHRRTSEALRYFKENIGKG